MKQENSVKLKQPASLYCELKIISKSHSPEAIQRLLGGIPPTRQFTKDENYKGPNAKKTHKRPWNLWELQSKVIPFEDLDNYNVNTCINDLILKLGSSIQLIRQLKESEEFKVSLWIHQDSNNELLDIEIEQPNIEIISSIVNYIHVAIF